MTRVDDDGTRAVLMRLENEMRKDGSAARALQALGRWIRSQST
jgi:hypothetical protein